MNYRIIKIILALVFPACLSAEIYNCNGTWSNKPCEGEVINSFEEIHSKPKTAKEISADKKNIIITELNNLKYRAEKETGLPFVVSDVTAICSEPEISLEMCQEKANDRIQQITAKMNRDLSKEKYKEKQEKAKEQKPDVNIVVNDLDDPYYWDKRYYKPKKSKVTVPIKKPKTPDKPKPVKIKPRSASVGGFSGK